MVLELARLRALDRPVPGVVHARRDLVREQLAADLEQLDREHADVVEVVEERRGDRRGLAGERVGDAGRRRPARRAGCRRGARSRRAASSRSSRRARAPRASTARGRTGRSPRGSARRPRRAPPTPRRASARRVAQHDLALAVVAAPPRLQDRRDARSRSTAAGSPARSSTAANSATAMPSARNVSFSASRSWATSSAIGPGRTGSRASSSRGAGRGHALPLVGDDVRAVGDLAAARARRRARRRRARRPRRRAPRATGRGTGSRTPSGTPASPSIRPSCPPPRTATDGRSRSRIVTPDLLVDGGFVVPHRYNCRLATASSPRSCSPESDRVRRRCGPGNQFETGRRRRSPCA